MYSRGRAARPVPLSAPAQGYQPSFTGAARRTGAERNEHCFPEPITEHELEQVERANVTTATPVVFVHGLWLLPSSWDRWAELFEQAVQRVSHISLEPNPTLVQHAKQCAESVQNRIADQITAFAGSMAFVYIHIVWFGCWIEFAVEGYPSVS